jgi:cell fate (sporulation/competence/biofilm development) regulator YlbF (YheA/YmcA/DUF963 family)
MDCASSEKMIQGLGDASHQLDAAAQTLIERIRQTPEYQDYTRALKAVNEDPELNRLTVLLGRKRRGLDPEGLAQEALQQQVEALPAVQIYRVAEARIKAFFRAIDDVIGGEAGVSFAEFARPRACG